LIIFYLLLIIKMDSEELKRRIKDFAHRCVKLAMALPNTAPGKHIKGQLIRCSTSAAANYRATCIAQSKADFTAKLSIVIEETDESCFWMEFIIAEKLLRENQVCDLLEEGKELTAIFIKSRKTTKNRRSEFVTEN
jgi:four helix bundle protein